MSKDNSKVIVLNNPDGMEGAVAYLKKYIATYDEQFGYKNYCVETVIEDILYGLGVAIDPDNHRFATGHRLFKEKLLNHLKKGQ